VPPKDPQPPIGPPVDYDAIHAQRYVDEAVQGEFPVVAAVDWEALRQKVAADTVEVGAAIYGKWMERAAR
jgi:hypothetical protein